MNHPDDYLPALDSFRSYTVAIEALREAGVRDGSFLPLTDDERRQAAEGPRHWSELDCVRRGRS
jgi:hypothetical protein